MNLPNFAAASAKLANLAMPRLRFHSNRRSLWMAAILSLLMLTSGCALFEKDRWNVDQYRDQRAVDIEHRLERDKPIVKNPF